MIKETKEKKIAKEVLINMTTSKTNKRIIEVQQLQEAEAEIEDPLKMIFGTEESMMVEMSTEETLKIETEVEELTNKDDRLLETLMI